MSLLWAKCQVTKNPFHILQSCLLHQLAVDWRKNLTKTEATAAEQPRWPGNFPFRGRSKGWFAQKDATCQQHQVETRHNTYWKLIPYFKKRFLCPQTIPQNFWPCDASPGSPLLLFRQLGTLPAEQADLHFHIQSNQRAAQGAFQRGLCNLSNAKRRKETLHQQIYMGQFPLLYKKVFLQCSIHNFCWTNF